LQYYDICGLKQWGRIFRQEISIYSKCASWNFPNHMCIATIMIIEIAFARGLAISAKAFLSHQGLNNVFKLLKSLSLFLFSPGAMEILLSIIT